MGIFGIFYNNENSAKVAKKRLDDLIHENINKKILEMEAEFVSIIKDKMEIDKSHVKIKIINANYDNARFKTSIIISYKK